MQAGAVAQGVVGEVEHVIGLVIGQMNLEQVQLVIDGIDQADLAGQDVKGADAAMGQSAAALGDLVVDVGRGEHGPVHSTQTRFVEAALDSALAVCQLAAYVGVHSKSFSRWW